MSRGQIAYVIGATTPAKLARVVSLLRPVELQLGLAKMRVRRTPPIQAHVTNRMDDPLLIAADAATRSRLGSVSWRPRSRCSPTHHASRSRC